MGQNQSGAIVSLSGLENGSSSSSTDETATKLEHLLRELSEKHDDPIVLSEWEKYINKKTKSSLERWGLLSLAIRLLEQWGKSKLMMVYAIRQIELAQELNSETNGIRKSSSLTGSVLVADSYLTLARVNFLLSHYTKSIEYVKKCLANISKSRGSNHLATKLSGYAYLCKGKANLGLSKYKEALEDFESSLSLAHGQGDRSLECLACCGMSSLYAQVKDYEKAAFFSLKASDLLQEYGRDWNRKYFTTIQLCLAEAYRKVGKVEEAMNNAEDAMRAAMENQDRRSQAYCMLCFADVHRVRKDIDRSIPRYDAAGRLMVEVGDRYGESMVALGKAKVYLKMTDFSKALVEYESSLQIATSIENKMACMRIYGEMTVLYERVRNHDMAKSCTLRYHQLLESMDLFCGVCDEPFGEKHEQLEALSCSHLFHLRCVSEQGLQLVGTLACPTCRKQLMKPVTL